MTAWTYCNATAEPMRMQSAQPHARGRKLLQMPPVPPCRKSSTSRHRRRSDDDDDGSGGGGGGPVFRIDYRRRSNWKSNFVRESAAITDAARQVSIRAGSASAIYIVGGGGGGGGGENEDAVAGRDPRHRYEYQLRRTNRRLANKVDGDDRDNEQSRYRGNANANNLTVLRSVLYLLPKYEAQEISTLLLDSEDSDAANTDVEPDLDLNHQNLDHIIDDHGFIDSKTRCEEEGRAKGSGGGGGGGGGCSVENFSEELCDDFDDTSSDENDYTLRKSQRSPTCAARTRARTAEKNFMASVQSQNIYEFVKKARKTMRKSWSSFNQQMRRSSAFTNTNTNTNKNNNNVSVGGGGGGADPLRKDDAESGDGGGGGGGDGDEDEGEGEAASLPRSRSAIDARTKLSNNRAVASAGGSMRWTSFKTKLRPKYSTVGAASSSSIFYLNPEDLRFDAAATATAHNETNGSAADARVVVQEKSAVTRRRTTCVDLNATRAGRPSSPPPPPPIIGVVGKSQCAANENHDYDRDGDGDHHHHRHRDYQSQNDIGVGAFDVSRSRSRSRSPPSSSNSDLNLSLCSDLRLRFADEPLYQFYAESVAQLTTNASLLETYSNDSDGYEEIGSLTSRPSAMELITPSPNGHGQCRSLWCEVEEVKNSGFLEKLSIGRQKLQEAKFEVITSEASYYKSLSVLDKIFVNDARLRDENLVCKNDWKILFGNVAAVRKCSQALLSDLEKCWQEDIMLSGLSDVIFEHASTNFKIFVKYCSNQIYIDRTLKKLREEAANFAELIGKLEADPVCQSLSLHSFLMLPMQRITRMPLLVDAILSKLDPVDDRSDHKTFKTTLAKLNKIVKDCNENARKFERYEEMLLISRQLEFSRKDVKMFSVASSSRWLVRSGPLMHLNPPDAKLTITRKLTKNTIKLYFFLFNDVLVIAKKKSENSYAVVDYCLRNVLQMCAVEETNSSASSSSSSSLSPSPSPFLANLYLPHRYLVLLTILENHEGKTVEMVLSCDSDSTRQRWLEASYSRLTSDNPGEKLYEEWDCPQVLAVHAYVAHQPDELSLQNGDVVKVLKKTTDGWYHGERIRDGIIGWFPGNYTVEIASQHTRAKNLKLRHRLLTLSADYLQNQQQK